MDPDFYDNNPWDECFFLTLTVRLLRLLCVENLQPAIHHFYNVVKINRKPLAKAYFAVLSIWFVSAVVLYICERNDDQDDDGMYQRDRYRDVPTAMSYALVHLKGDYPLSVYNLPAKVYLTFVILFGIALIGAPTGIFASGFALYLSKI